MDKHSLMNTKSYLISSTLYLSTQNGDKSANIQSCIGEKVYFHGLVFMSEALHPQAQLVAPRFVQLRPNLRPTIRQHINTIEPSDNRMRSQLKKHRNEKHKNALTVKFE